MAGYPGMDGGGADPLLGGDPLLSGPEAGMHFVSQMMGSVTGQQANALYAGQLEAMAATFIEGFLTKMVTGAMQQMNQSAEWKPVIEGISDLVREMGAPSSSAETAPHSARRGATPPPPSPAPSTLPNAKRAGEVDPSKESSDLSAKAADQSKHRTESYDPRAAFNEGRDRGQQMTMGSIAKAAAAPLAKAVSSSEREWVPVATADGRKAYRYIDNLTGETVADERTGTPYEDIVEGEEGYDALARKVTRGAAIRSVATGVLTGSPVSGSVGALAAKVAGPVGLAYGAAQAGGAWMEAQTKAAQPYKAMYGEQASTFAATERFGEWKEGLKGFGNIGAEEARAAYRRSSEMGLTGAARDESASFQRDMERRFGMSGDAAGALVQQSLTQGGGTAALDGFSEAITRVSESAVEAGRLSHEAISQFVASQAVVGQMMSAQSATQVAEGLTGASMKMPKALSDQMGGAAGMAKGMLTDQNVMAAAAMGGQSPTAAYWNMLGSDTGFEQAAFTIEAISDLIFERAANFLGMSAGEFKQRLKDESGGKALSIEEQRAILSQIAGGRSGAGLLIRMLSQLTTQYMGEAAPDPKELVPLLFTMAEGTFTIEAPETTSADGPASGADRQGIAGSSGSTLNYGKADSSGEQSSLKMDLLQNTGRGSDGKPRPGTRGSVTSAMDQGDAFDAYLDMVSDTGKGDSTLEMLLNPANRSKILADSGVSDLDDVKYRIDGKEMTLSEAIESGMGPKVEGGSIVNVDKPNEPARAVRVVLDLSPDAKELVRDTGPTEAQRNLTPEGSSR